MNRKISEEAQKVMIEIKRLEESIAEFIKKAGFVNIHGEESFQWIEDEYGFNALRYYFDGNECLVLVIDMNEEASVVVYDPDLLSHYLTYLYFDDAYGCTMGGRLLQ